MATPPTPLPAALAGQIEQIAGHYLSSCEAGLTCQPESLLQQVPPEAAPALLRRLLAIECEHRARQGRPVTRAEAAARFAPLGPWVADLLGSFWPDEPTLHLDVIDGPLLGQTYRLSGHSSFLVGRGPDGVQLALPGDPGISRTHFLVEFNPPRARLIDLRSKNGTFVNGARVTEIELREGDEVRAGLSTFRARFPPGQHTLTVEGAPGHGHGPATDVFTRLTIPGYEVGLEIGRGGMGVVYRATRASDGLPVALKMVPPAVAPRPDTLARFQREMAILQRLEHPHIVRYLDTGSSGGLLYFVMEFVDGPSASQVVKQGGPLPPGRALPLAVQLLEALAHAHLQGFVHRDVKPGNVLIARAGGAEVLKLADFGLARTYQESAMSGLTLTGQPGGTPGYMAPEQILDFHSARPAADQYAAAATIYHLLTGRLIYEPAASTGELLQRVLQDEPLPVRSPDPALAPGLSAALCRALARDPRRRFPDVLALRDALRAP